MWMDILVDDYEELMALCCFIVRMTGATTKYFDTLLVFASKTMMSSLPKK
jgi:hypothetical protein